MIQPEPATAGNAGHETEVGSVFVSNYPPFSFWSEGELGAVERTLDEPPTDADFGVYLHIPFCRKRCKFCYFRVFTDKNASEIGVYLDALSREIEVLAERPAIAGRRPRFIYFGGGTPSFLSPKQLGGLVDRMKAVIPWESAEEITFECEPGTLTEAKVEAIREIGVTRLSLGIEHFDDEILRENGRAHVSMEIERCLPWIEKAGFDQLNIDLIAGMLGDRDDTWRDAVARTVDLAPDSVTIYQMELPFNTRFSKRLLDGSLETPVADWETKRRWHSYAIDQLAAAGYTLSSGYTMVREPDCRFVYRDSVWHGCDLLGTGVASFSHIGDVHFQNVDGWGEYLARVNEGRSVFGRALETSAGERLTRELILQLKLGRVGSEYFRRKFGVEILQRFGEPLHRLEARGMLTVDGDVVHLTREGLLRVDSLLPEFYDPAYRNSRYT